MKQLFQVKRDESDKIKSFFIQNMNHNQGEYAW